MNYMEIAGMQHVYESGYKKIQLHVMTIIKERYSSTPEEHDVVQAVDDAWLHLVRHYPLDEAERKWPLSAVHRCIDLYRKRKRWNGGRGRFDHAEPINQDPADDSELSLPDQEASEREELSLIDTLRKNDPHYFDSKEYIIRELISSFPLPWMQLYELVSQAIKDLLAEYGAELRQTSSAQKAYDRKLQALQLHHLSVEDVATKLGFKPNSHGQVSNIRIKQRKQIRTKVISKINDFALFTIEFPTNESDQDKIPNERPGVTVLKCEARSARDNGILAISPTGELSASLYTGEKTFECTEVFSDNKRATDFQCKNATLMLECRHPNVEHGKMTGVFLAWTRNGKSLGRDFHITGENAVASICVERFGDQDFWRRIALGPSTKITFFGGTEGKSITFQYGSSASPVQMTGPVKSIEIFTPPPERKRKKDHSVAEKTNTNVPRIEKIELPVGDLIVRDRLGAIIATTKPLGSFEPTNGLGERRGWGWPIHITAPADTTSNNSHINFRYFGHASRKEEGRKSKDAIELTIELEIRDKAPITKSNSNGGPK